MVLSLSSIVSKACKGRSSGRCLILESLEQKSHNCLAFEAGGLVPFGAISGSPQQLAMSFTSF